MIVLKTGKTPKSVGQREAGFVALKVTIFGTGEFVGHMV
jgi:hypothetical protein